MEKKHTNKAVEQSAKRRRCMKKEVCVLEKCFDCKTKLTLLFQFILVVKEKNKHFKTHSQQYSWTYLALKLFVFVQWSLCVRYEG